jgi:hypothetical protein
MPGSSFEIAKVFESPLLRIAISELRTLTLRFDLIPYFAGSESWREYISRNLRSCLHPLLLTSVQQTSNLQVIHYHLKMTIGSKAGRGLGFLIDSPWPTVFPVVMDEIRSLKTRIKDKYTVAIVHRCYNTPFIVAEKRLEIEKKLMDVLPMPMDGTSKCLTIEWKDDIHWGSFHCT